MKIQLTESQLNNIIAENIKKHILILENEGTNMKKARRYLENMGYTNPEERQRILDSIRTDIPNSRLMDCYYLLGVTRLFIDGELNNYQAISNINTTLKYVASDAHYKEYDSNLNNLSLMELYNRFKTNINDDFFANKEKSSKRQLTKNSDYTIVRIPDFETASKYGKYTSWCVTHNENMYDSYTNGGSGLFYFCLRKGFERITPQEGENCPLDEYGLSMIAVSVDSQGEMNTITCRWNHDNGGNDTIMSVEELENLLGVNFYKTFLPYSKDELITKGLWISEKIGELYDDGVIKGIICAVDEMESPTMVISLTEDDREYTWEEAMEYGKTLQGPWHIPSKEELEEVWHNSSEVTKMLNRGIKKHNGRLLHGLYWSSSQYSARCAYYVLTGFGHVYSNVKYNSLYVRPFASLS